MPVHEIRHPLIRHKLGIMRRADLSTKMCIRDRAMGLSTCA